MARYCGGSFSLVRHPAAPRPQIGGARLRNFTGEGETTEHYCLPIGGHRRSRDVHAARSRDRGSDGL